MQIEKVGGTSILVHVHGIRKELLKELLLIIQETKIYNSQVSSVGIQRVQASQ